MAEPTFDPTQIVEGLSQPVKNALLELCKRVGKSVEGVKGSGLSGAQRILLLVDAILHDAGFPDFALQLKKEVTIRTPAGAKMTQDEMDVLMIAIIICFFI